MNEGQRVVASTAELLAGLHEAAQLEHLGLVLIRPAGEALVIHVTPDRSVWWNSTREIEPLRSLVSEFHADDEEDVTAKAMAFEPTASSAPIDEMFGGALLRTAERVGSDQALLTARDAVERVWLAWRFEVGKVISVEETPAYFDEQLKAIDAFASVPANGRARKPRLRLAAVGDPRTVKMSPEVQRLMEMQLERFREKFGRDPGPEDPVFFDPDADEPRPLPESKLADMAAMMGEMGFDEEFRQRKESELIASGAIRRVGRNDRCPCGSGRKYKNCHGR